MSDVPPDPDPDQALVENQEEVADEDRSETALTVVPNALPVVVPASGLDESQIATGAALVKKSNVLAEARYSLSARGQKFLLFAISIIDPEDKELKKWYWVHADAFARWGGLDVRAVRRDLHDAPVRADSIVGELAEQWLLLPDLWVEDKQIYVPHMARWIIDKAPEKQKGPCNYVGILFNPNLAPLLIDVRDKFYFAKQVIVAKLESRYAIRLYEWIQPRLFQVTSQRPLRVQVTLDELRAILMTDMPVKKTAGQLKSNEVDYIDIGDIRYQRRLALFANFKNKALDVALKEVNGHMDCDVSYETIKAPGSKRVIAVAFTIARKAKEVLPAPPPANEKAGSPSSQAGNTNVPANPDAQENVLLFGAEKSAPDPGAGVPLAVATPPPDAEQEALEARLAEYVAKVVKRYGLNSKQRELVAIAQSFGCQTPQQCAAYIDYHLKSARRSAKTRAEEVRHFMAGINGGAMPTEITDDYPRNPFRETGKSPGPARPASTGSVTVVSTGAAEAAATAEAEALPEGESGRAQPQSAGNFFAQMKRNVAGKGMSEHWDRKAAEEKAASDQQGSLALE